MSDYPASRIFTSKALEGLQRITAVRRHRTGEEKVIGSMEGTVKHRGKWLQASFAAAALIFSTT
jgi:hypothetical protein